MSWSGWLKIGRLNTSSSPADDAELVRQARRGSGDAAAKVVDRYARRLLGFSNRILGDLCAAEDLVQEVFDRVFCGRGLWRDDDHFSIWIFRLARNLALDRLRARKVREKAADHLGRKLNVYAPAADDKLQDNEVMAALSEALAELPEEFRTAFLLRERDGRTYEDIALIMDIPEKTVSTRIHRARMRVRVRLESYFRGENAATRRTTDGA